MNRAATPCRDAGNDPVALLFRQFADGVAMHGSGQRIGSQNGDRSQKESLRAASVMNCLHRLQRCRALRHIGRVGPPISSRKPSSTAAIPKLTFLDE